MTYTISIEHPGGKATILGCRGVTIEDGVLSFWTLAELEGMNMTYEFRILPKTKILIESSNEYD